MKLEVLKFSSSSCAVVVGLNPVAAKVEILQNNFGVGMCHSSLKVVRTVCESCSSNLIEKKSKSFRSSALYTLRSNYI